MARKVFISVLGTGFYKPCRYTRGEFKSTETRFIQQATLEYLNVSEWCPDDAFLFLLTERARTTNWNKKIGARVNTLTKKEECYLGLEKILSDMTLPSGPTAISIPDGKDEDEMWEIFSILFKALKEGDELYIDLTHSFRYLPMLVLVLSNYAKFLLNAKVKSLSYGNFEVLDVATNEAPIVDLLPLSALQDWTFAAGQYLDSGYVDRLVNLSNNEIKPILRDTEGKDAGASSLRCVAKALSNVVDERITCRGLDIIGSKEFSLLKKSLTQCGDTFVQPLNPILDKIRESLDGFDEKENINNAYFAAVWCYENGQYQQSATLLQEYVITSQCKQCGYDVLDDNKRKLISSAFRIKNITLQESDWDLADEDDKATLHCILQNPLFSDEKMVSSFETIRQIRNDLNHSGMRNAPQIAKIIKKNIEKCLEQIKMTLIDNADSGEK